MGWDIWGVIDTGGSSPAQVTKDFGYTYNTSGMLRAVGIDWPTLLGKSLSELVPILQTGLDRLLAEPARFEAMNPDNGWGSYEGLCKILAEVIEDFSEHPKATLAGWL